MQPTRFMLCIRHVTPTCIPVVSHRCNMKIIFKVKLQNSFNYSSYGGDLDIFKPGSQ